MKVLIEIPSWLGDSVMSTPAIENLMNYYNSAQVILVGSKESIQLFFGHHNRLRYAIVKAHHACDSSAITFLFNIHVGFKVVENCKR